VGKKNETKSTSELKRSLIALLEEGQMIPGSIKKQWNVCGMPGCRCKDPREPRKHGPYYQLSFTLAGKSTSMFIKDAEYELMRTANDRYRKFKALSLELVQAYVRKERQERKNRRRP
jgi:hypothetical protein